MEKFITMSHGSGGALTSQLIENIIVDKLNNKILNKLEDGALLEVGASIGFSTDSFVIYPHFFPGGDIGKLSICGTVNDLIMCGCIPKYISLSFILEEGYAVDDITRIVNSIQSTSKQCGVKIVTGDTKVVEKGCGSGIYINTAGIGEKITELNLGLDRLEEGDKVIVTGNVGDHGISILCAREELMETDIYSDCAPLYELIDIIKKYGKHIKIMRDPTRGGIATTLNEFVEKRNICIELKENDIPVDDRVMGACELLGIDPLYSANEGKAILVVSKNISSEIIDDLRKVDKFKYASVIGEVTREYSSKVIVTNNYGGKRILGKLTSDILPRIC